MAAAVDHSKTQWVVTTIISHHGPCSRGLMLRFYIIYHPVVSILFQQTEQQRTTVYHIYIKALLDFVYGYYSHIRTLGSHLCWCCIMQYSLWESQPTLCQRLLMLQYYVTPAARSSRCVNYIFPCVNIRHILKRRGLCTSSRNTCSFSKFIFFN